MNQGEGGMIVKMKVKVKVKMCTKSIK